MRVSLGIILTWAAFLPLWLYPSSFFPTNEELEDLKSVQPKKLSTGKDNSSENLTPHLTKDGKSIQIDDMLFPVDEARPLSGFLFTANKWPNGRVVYEFESVTSSNMRKWLNAAKE